MLQLFQDDQTPVDAIHTTRQNCTCSDADFVDFEQTIVMTDDRDNPRNLELGPGILSVIVSVSPSF